MVTSLSAIAVQSQQMDADDPMAGYILQAGARICKCLGLEFLPYMSVVMPDLLKSAMLKPDVQVADTADEDDDNEDDDEEVNSFEHIAAGFALCAC